MEGVENIFVSLPFWLLSFVIVGYIILHVCVFMHIGFVFLNCILTHVTKGHVFSLI